jgi:hypothetical protein
MGEEQNGVTTAVASEEEARHDVERRLAEIEEARDEGRRRAEKKAAKPNGKDEESPAEEVSTLRNEIEDIRDDLGHYITELDRRRHEAFDLKAQFQKHREVVIGVGVGLVGLVGALVAFRVRAARRPRSIAERLQEKLGDRMVEQVRKHDLLDTLGRAAIGIAAAGVATAIKSVIEKKVKGEVRESPRERHA